MSPVESFWSFSLRIYAVQGVESACLDLQDRFGIDVNMALYCLWIGRKLTPEALARALEVSEPLHMFVKPLREMRRSMPKDGGNAAREAIKTAELKAEKLEQEALEALGPADSPDPAAAATNLRAYAGVLALDEDMVMEAAAPLVAALA